jgi:hypothetical protein
MQPIQEDINEFRRQLRGGSIQKAYRALLDYMMRLRLHFKESYPKYTVSGLYQGSLDMTYFAIVPPSFKRRDLKIAIVFDYGAFRFEAWLAARNRQVQRKYWELFRHSRWADYRVVTPAIGVDSIIECDLADQFDVRHLDTLTASLQEKAAKFIKDLDRFLSEHKTGSRP